MPDLTRQRILKRPTFAAETNSRSVFHQWDHRHLSQLAVDQW